MPSSLGVRGQGIALPLPFYFIKKKKDESPVLAECTVLRSWPVGCRTVAFASGKALVQDAHGLLQARLDRVENESSYGSGG